MWRRSVCSTNTPLSIGIDIRHTPLYRSCIHLHDRGVWIYGERCGGYVPLGEGCVCGAHGTSSLERGGTSSLERGHGGNEVSPAHIVEEIFDSPLLFRFHLFPYLYAFI